MPCLTPLGINKLKDMLTTDGSKLSQLARMETAKRKEVINKFMGDNTDYVNYEIEKRLVAKTTESLKNWVEKEVTRPKVKSDILKRIGKLAESINDPKRLSLLTNEKARTKLIEDLIAHKIGVAVSQEEAGVIIELASEAETARKELTKIANAETKYGKAYNLTQRGISLEESLKESGITKAEYNKITEERIQKGLLIYKYVDYMDKVKNEAFALKKEDFTRGWYEASLKTAKEVFDSFRAVLSSGELGFIFRQGLKSMYYNPKIWFRNSIESMSNAIKGFKNIDFKSTVMAEILTRPNYLSGHYKEAGLAINTVEDYYKNTYVERVIEADRPNIFQNLGQRYIKFSQDTYLIYLYKLRADMFDAHWDKLQESGVEYKKIGEFFNNLTGRGEGAFQKKAGGLMFAPKYVQSQINSFTKMFTETNPTIRMEYFKNFASMLAGTMTILYLSFLMGADIEKDPRSTNFGRITLPNGYIIDITGGLATYIILVSRIITGEKLTGKGKKVKLGSFGQEDAKDLIANFMFSKGSPAVSMTVALMNRELYGGKELTPASFAGSLMPIFGQEAYEKLTDDNIEALDKLLLTTSAFFGLSSYSPSAFDKRRTK